MGVSCSDNTDNVTNYADALMLSTDTAWHPRADKRKHHKKKRGKTVINCKAARHSIQVVHMLVNMTKQHL